MNLFQKVFGTRSEHEVKRIMPLVEKTESFRPEMQNITEYRSSVVLFFIRDVSQR